MPRPLRLEPDPGAMSTSAGRRDLQRASVALAARLETSPALWRVDRATGNLEIGGVCLERVQTALDKGDYPFRLTDPER